MAGMTWLHLSDWHQKGKDFNRHVVGDKLLEDIRNRRGIHPDLEKVDLVIFSGDVAFSGKAEEYQAAIESLFKPVLEATGLETNRLFIIPGNHDFDRDEIEFLPEGIKRPFESNERVNEWLTNDRQRSFLLSPFAAYQEFVSKYTGQNQPIYASIQRVEGLDKSLALLGLNSALMCNRHKNERNETDDRGFLVVGEPQIHDQLRNIADAEVRIAVVHHPFDWLTEFDDDHVEGRLKRECHFILCGHLHKPKVTLEQGTAGECVIIPAGSLYDKRIPHNPRYTNAYNFVHLDFDTVQGTIYLRRWSEINTKWTADTESAPNGFLQFRLPKYPQAELKPAQTEHVVQQSSRSIDKTKLAQALGDSYDVDGLEIFLVDYFNTPLTGIVVPHGLSYLAIIRKVIDYFDRRGSLVDLVREFQRDRPGKIDILDLLVPSLKSVDIQKIDPGKLRRAMSRAYNFADLQLLCANLQVPYENIEGSILETKILHLIQYCQRHNLYDILVHQVLQERPHLWSELAS